MAPAGLTAAIYAARANLKPLVFEGPQPGGQLTITTDVENYPGFQHPVEGPKLMDDMRAQAERVGSEIRRDWVNKIDLTQRPFALETSDSGTILAQTLIIATGADGKVAGIRIRAVPRQPGRRRLGLCGRVDGFFL